MNILEDIYKREREKESQEGEKDEGERGSLLNMEELKDRKE